jgi:hypothetical protein
VKIISGIACPRFHVEFRGNIANKSHHISISISSPATPGLEPTKPEEWNYSKWAQPGDVSGAAREPIPRLERFFFLVPSFPVKWTGYFGLIFFKKSRCFLFSFEMTCEASHRVVYHPGN